MSKTCGPERAPRPCAWRTGCRTRASSSCWRQRPCYLPVHSGCTWQATNDPTRPTVSRSHGARRSSPTVSSATAPATTSRSAVLYRSADMFVLPSRWETFGTVYAEALDAGLPVIGWRSGNLPHLVDDGTQGIVITPGDVGALTRALRRLADDEPERRRMGAAAARRALELPTWDQSARQFFSILAGTS